MDESTTISQNEPIAETPKIPRRKRKGGTVVPVADIQTIFAEQPIEEEDTTPVEWDGSLPEPPFEWMRNHTWKVITSIEDLRDWWEAVKRDTPNHVPSVRDILDNTGKVHPKIGFDLETTGLDNRLVYGQSKTHVVGGNSLTAFGEME